MDDKVKAEIAKNLRNALKDLSLAVDAMNADGKKRLDKPIDEIIKDHDLIQMSKIGFLNESFSSVKNDIRKLLFYFI